MLTLKHQLETISKANLLEEVKALSYNIWSSKDLDLINAELYDNGHLAGVDFDNEDVLETYWANLKEVIEKLG